jgi:hypothetical protein
MTQRKHFKRLVRERMGKTGEQYAAARRHVVGSGVAATVPGPHLPGNNPATAALRVLLAAAGVRDPRTGGPLSEAMVLGVAGGIGAGVFAFRYEKEDSSSFFVAGRHSWQDDLRFLTDGARRFGVRTEVGESSGAATADRILREALSAGRPAIAWVDMGTLPYRAMPTEWSGGGYHVVVVYSIDPETGAASLGDLAEEPFLVTRGAFADARARIRKQKNRVLSLAGEPEPLDLASAVRAGLEACRDGLLRPQGTNFSLEAFRIWGERLRGGRDKESWSRAFPPGRALWQGLTSVADFVEHYGTGGGLLRPLFAEFLVEAAEATGDRRLAPIAARYAEVGRQWSALANAALPDDVPAFAEAKRLLAEKAELFFGGGAPDEIGAIWKRLGELREAAAEAFPLAEPECDALKEDLSRRVLAIYEEEKGAFEELGSVVGRR